MTMDHEDCSALLTPYVRGELHAATAAEVEEHLASCRECRSEEAGVRALLEAPAEPLTDLERATLHREVRAQVEVPERSQKERLAWLPPALTAAAVLVVVVMGIRFVSGGGGSDDGDSTGAGQPVQDSGAAQGPLPVTLRLAGGSLNDANTRSGAAASEESAPLTEPEPRRAPKKGREEPLRNAGSADAAAGFVRGERLANYARSSATFVGFARAYRAEDVDRLRDGFIARLSADAPAAAAAQVVECADLVVGEQSHPMLPVVAGHGRFEGEPSLLLGFVWSDKPAGRLDRYWLFVWPRGSCDIPTHSQAGEIRG